MVLPNPYEAAEPSRLGIGKADQWHSMVGWFAMYHTPRTSKFIATDGIEGLAPRKTPFETATCIRTVEHSSPRPGMEKLFLRPANGNRMGGIENYSTRQHYAVFIMPL